MRNAENLIAQENSNHERKAAAILLALSLVTTGNAVAVAAELREPAIANVSVPQPSFANAAPAANHSVVTEPVTPETHQHPQPTIQESPAAVPEIIASPNITPAITEPQKQSPAAPTEQSPLSNSLQLQKKASVKIATSEVQPMSKITEANIAGMQLSREGYEYFRQNIDTSYFDFAQQYTPFNPEKVAIKQGTSEFFTLHFTAVYSNADGMSQIEAKGNMDLGRLIDFMGKRNKVCCGVNWILGRDGTVYQTAPINAKLRHNPPYDSINTGVEVESTNQDNVTTKQYEALAYLSVAVLKHQELLAKPLEQTIHGHGEDRDKYREQNPNSKWGARNDFDAPVAGFYRHKIAEFLYMNPGLPGFDSTIR